MNWPQQAAFDAARSLFPDLLADGYMLACVHVYDTEAGEALYYRARFVHPQNCDKEIRPFYATAGGWRIGEPKLSPKPLYGLSRLGRLRQQQPLVFIVEGEKVADALNAFADTNCANFTAVTSGGSSSAKAADWKPLEGLSCLVWPDNDPPGATYANDVQAALRGAAGLLERVAVEQLNLPHKGDAVEWLAANPNAGADAMASLPRVPVLSVADDNVWPDPVPLPDTLPRAPAWDWDLLPPELAPRVRCTASRLSVPPEVAAVPLLTALGGVVGRSHQLSIRDGWTVIPNLWGMVIAPPAMLKSPAQSEGTFMLAELEAEALAQYSEDRKQAAVDAAVRDLMAKQLKKDAGKAVKDQNHGAARELARQAIEGDTKAVPPQQRFRLQSFTVEKLGEVLRDNPRGVTICLDELMGLFRQCERSGHEQDRAFLLTAADGDKPLSWDTLGRGTVSVPAACISVLGSIQPNPLRELLRELEGSGGDGLMQRFGLMVRPDLPKVYAPTREKEDGDARDRVRALFRKVAETVPVDSGGGPATYRLSPEAQAIFNEWEDRHRNGLLNVGEEHAALTSHLQKLPKTIAALSLLFRLCRVEDFGVEVTGEDMARALRWADFLASHAERVYRTSKHRKAEAAAALLRRMKAGELPRTIQARDVYRNQWSLLSDPEEVRAALEVLDDFGWVRGEVKVTAGRTARVWDLHPSLPSVAIAAA